MSKPLILLSNDDGFLADGIHALREALLALGDVVVCAPATEQSASSHALTLDRPLRIREASEGVLAIDGTPADCVYVALHSGNRILARRPDLVVSGMNHGANLGTDVFYSGTVAAAREGALRGIPSLALSAAEGTDLRAAAGVSRRLAETLIDETGGEPALLNVNFPPGHAWPVRATRLGARLYSDEVVFREDPRGKEYLWIGGPGSEHVDIEDSDTDAWEAGVVGVTPLVLDLHCRLQGGLASRVAIRAAHPA